LRIVDHVSPALAEIGDTQPPIDDGAILHIFSSKHQESLSAPGVETAIAAPKIACPQRCTRHSASPCGCVKDRDRY
jgi:hypothetical protein